MSLIGATLAFFFLDGVLRVVVIAALLLTDVAEIALWLKWRNKRTATGAEGLIGARSTVVTACEPRGQVKLKGQIWSARCNDGAPEGETVVVTGVDGVSLEVAPAGTDPSTSQ